jgi:hypothetical protein
MDKLYYIGQGDWAAVYVSRRGGYEHIPPADITLAQLQELGVAPAELLATGLYSETDPAVPVADGDAQQQPAADTQPAADGEAQAPADGSAPLEVPAAAPATIVTPARKARREEVQ